MLEGLETLPVRPIEYRGTTLREFDLDAALARKPTVILVDELAHTNAPGMRHAKRWQDIEELLQAGISVYTTVNVQHLESLNDVVTRVTGVAVRETVPDSVMESADEIELIDLPPEDLIQRLAQGKVYVPEQAQQAAQRFFRKGNLIALRELALRRAAETVDAQMRGYRLDHTVEETWPVTERLMVCIGPSPFSQQLIRAAKRMATQLRAEWIVANVQTPQWGSLPEETRSRAYDALRLAEQLGADTATLSGANISTEVLNYARARNVSKILIGKPADPLWRRLWSGSILDKLIEGSGEIDVYAVSARKAESAAPIQSAAQNDALGPIRRRHAGRRGLYAYRSSAAPATAFRKHRDAVSARRGSCGHASEQGPVCFCFSTERDRIRLFFHDALSHAARGPRAVRHHLRSDACGLADHQWAHRTRSQPGCFCRGTRAAHGDPPQNEQFDGERRRPVRRARDSDAAGC